MEPFCKVKINTFILKLKAWIFYLFLLELILHGQVLLPKKKLHGKKIQSKYGNLCFNYIQIKMIPFLQRWFKIMKWMTDEYFHAPHKFLIRRRRRISLFTVLSVSVFLFHAQSLSHWNLTNSASNFEGELKKLRFDFSHFLHNLQYNRSPPKRRRVQPNLVWHPISSSIASLTFWE